MTIVCISLTKIGAEIESQRQYVNRKCNCLGMTLSLITANQNFANFTFFFTQNLCPNEQKMIQLFFPKNMFTVNNNWLKQNLHNQTCCLCGKGFHCVQKCFWSKTNGYQWHHKKGVRYFWSKQSHFLLNENLILFFCNNIFVWCKLATMLNMDAVPINNQASPSWLLIWTY